MYKTILFDMDGTLCDTDLMLVETFLQMYKKYRPDYKPTINHMVYFSGPPILVTLKKEFPDQDLNLMLKEFVDISTPLYYTTVVIYPYLKELLLSLKKQGIKLGVVTGKRRDMTLKTISILELENIFDVLVCSDDVKNAKPDKEPIVAAINVLKVKDISEVLYIGDNVVDYLSSSAAGVDCCLVTWTPRHIPNDIHPKYFLDSYKDFYEVIKWIEVLIY